MNVPVSRPSWTDFLIGLAKCASRKSPDANTKHGCVLANHRHQVLSLGFNGWPHGLKDDSAIPNTREGNKYPWFLHGETNSIANSPGKVEGATAYVTGRSCFNCMLHLWQNGVKKIVQVKGYGWQKDEEEKPLKDKFLALSDMCVEEVEPDLSWLVDMVLEDEQLRAEVVRRLGKE